MINAPFSPFVSAAGYYGPMNTVVPDQVANDSASFVSSPGYYGSINTVDPRQAANASALPQEFVDAPATTAYSDGIFSSGKNCSAALLVSGSQGQPTRKQFATRMRAACELMGAAKPSDDLVARLIACTGDSEHHASINDAIDKVLTAYLQNPCPTTLKPLKRYLSNPLLTDKPMELLLDAVGRKQQETGVAGISPDALLDLQFSALGDAPLNRQFNDTMTRALQSFLDHGSAVEWSALQQQAKLVQDAEDATMTEAVADRPALFGLDTSECSKGKTGMTAKLFGYLPTSESVAAHVLHHFPDTRLEDLARLHLTPSRTTVEYTPSAHRPGALDGQFTLEFNDPANTPAENCMRFHVASTLLQRVFSNAPIKIDPDHQRVSIPADHCGTFNDIGFDIPMCPDDRNYLGEKIFDITSSHNGSVFYPPVFWRGRHLQQLDNENGHKVVEVTHLPATVVDDPETRHVELGLQLALPPIARTKSADRMNHLGAQLTGMLGPDVVHTSDSTFVIGASQNGSPGTFLDAQNRPAIRFMRQCSPADVATCLHELGLTDHVEVAREPLTGNLIASTLEVPAAQLQQSRDLRQRN